MRPTAEERFWSKVDKSGECWIWTGRRKEEGYGKFRIDNRELRAHRYSWELDHGPIPPGMDVCHDCPGGDNPRCVNPAHLFLGTRADNNRDMVKKDRIAHGSTHPCARLSEETVRQIRADYIPWKFGYGRLAKKYGLQSSHVRAIISRRQWRRA